ncbi:hypothetical protein PsYK624_038230 [Phanerochaete sordida]|uniref:Uncharacterized protein n=1 Tax=Phanerochaete sordida TaxID=48140 RepID=A0A9P3G4K7_9APHY|nr:hypothetical protein PsYK624_038230 [Phanerochaete sordida]
MRPLHRHLVSHPAKAHPVQAVHHTTASRPTSANIGRPSLSSCAALASFTTLHTSRKNASSNRRYRPFRGHR